MADKKATREAYGDALVEFGAAYKNLVVLDADLAEATKTCKFKAAYPDRFFDCGIAEGNMMGVAAGLAASGMIPFASSFAMFAAGRAFEQIRNCIGYPHLNVKIGATHAGITVGEIGRGVELRDGKDVSIVATGLTVSMALEAAELLAADGISARVINIHTIKPIDENLLVKAAKETGAVVTAEEHSIIGGLGSAVCEVLAEKMPVPVRRVGVNDKFGKSGQVPDLLNAYGLTAAHIAEVARELVAAKK